MDNQTSQAKVDSTAIIVTADQFQQAIKKSPALPPLSETDMQRANELARSLVRSEERLDDIVYFGNEAQEAQARIAKDMLSGVRVGALDEVVQLSDGVLGQIQTLDIKDLSPEARKLILGIQERAADIQNRIKNFFRKLDQVNTRLDRQEAEIFARETASTERYYKNAELGKAAREVVREAQVMRMAIDLFLNSEFGYAERDRRQAAIANDLAAAGVDDGLFSESALTLAPYANYIERLEMKKEAMLQVTHSSLQTMLIMRMMSNNENIIRQKLSDIRIDLLPQWRILIAIAYNAYQQQGIAEFVEKIKKADAELRTQTADQIEKTAIEIARGMRPPLVSSVVMQYTNDKLISSLNILKTASEEAKKIRDEAEEEMQKLIVQLSEGVAATSVRKE